jgi:hypothetical protein
MLPSVKAGSVASFTIPVQSADGSVITATASTWTLKDARGASVTTGSAVGFVANDAEAEISISAIHITTDVSRRGMELAVTFVTGSGPVTTSDYFFILSESLLTVAENSFQTYLEALSLRSSFGQNFSGWDNADEETRVSALEQSYARLAPLTYQVRERAAGASSSYAGFGLGFSSDDQIYSVALQGISLVDFDALPAKFINALRRAQLVEADSILDGESIFSKISSGIKSERIGESDISFAQSAPLQLGMSKAAYAEISRYLVFRVRIARG